MKKYFNVNHLTKPTLFIFNIVGFVIGILCCSIPSKGSIIEVSNIEQDFKLIPIINYTPDDFPKQIISHFKFDKYSESLFLDRKEDNNIFLWYNDLLDNGIYKFDSVSPKLSTFQYELICKEDSLFVFNPLPTHKVTPRTIKYIGLLKNGNFLIENKGELMSLEDFINSEFGSVENYSQCYINAVKSKFYSSGSGIYDIHSTKEANNVLKNNFIFNLMSNSANDKLCNLLFKLISNRLCISSIQSDKLRNVVGNLSNNHIDALDDFLAGKSYFLPKNSNLHSVFSHEELKIIENIFLEENARLRIAFSFLNSKNLNIDNSGHYISDKDVFNIIKESVFVENE